MRLASSGLAALAMGAIPHAALAQRDTAATLAPTPFASSHCDTIVSRSSAAALSGARIRTLTITPTARESFPAERLLRRLHVTTRRAAIRRDLRFAPGDTVDTLAIAETMRRLRQRPYLTDAEIVATRCGDDADVAVRTIDRWSLTLSLAASSTSSYGGIEERNVLGTGRAVSMLVASRQGKTGGALGYTDPYLFDLPIFVRARAARFADGSELRARFRNAEQSVYDRWRVQLTMAEYRQDTQRTERFGGEPVLVAQAFHRTGAFLVVGRRVGDTTRNVTSVLVGADFEHASLNAPDEARTVGPKLVERRYHGPSVGLARRAVAFDTVNWVGARHALLDVPRGIEMEGMIGAGREDVARRGAGFGSVWIGRMWVPTPDRVFLVDVWSSGYLVGGRDTFDAASSRAVLAAYVHAGATVFSLHGAAEKVVNPDPDMRALATFDPTLALLPQAYRLSENALAGELEATHPLRSIGRLADLQGAIFTAGSLRTASALSQSDHIGVAAIGAGLRVVPLAQGSGTLRLDVLYPVAANRNARHGATVAVSVAPWLQANRQREDPRLRQ